ncbi:MAG: penicillin-binding protein 1C [Bacteroidetes bacterium]|nr:MAG: penicillin-binding protein 1C [Bacteroidota bacterium]
MISSIGNINSPDSLLKRITVFWRQLRYRKRNRLMVIVIAMLLLVLISLSFFYPGKLFSDPWSAILKDKNGQLLSARIAADGQWRFPPPDSIPEKYIEALLSFEDKRFYYHPGIDVVATMRALYSNLKADKVISGGSTISMQVIRISRKGQKRTIGEKINELWRALALELFRSKREILLLYAANAPYGGNVVGLEAASWRWFGRNPDDLSWAEAASLAILPNAPSLISLQRNRGLFLARRNNLLKRLKDEDVIDELTYQLSVAEPLPAEPKPLPDKAPHYLEYLRKQQGDRLYQSTIDPVFQRVTADLLMSHHMSLKANQIRNGAVIVRDLRSGDILAYQGNVPAEAFPKDQFNDMIQAERSSGSILKPFLFAAALQDGYIHPGSLLPDIPSWISGFNPKNFDEKYSGAVPASQALQRSLNVPFVHLLRDYGVNRFYDLLQELGFTTFKKPAYHYGLSLILGGGEVNLWELTKIYANFGKVLVDNDIDELFPIGEGSAYLTADVLRALNRPETESGWTYYGQELNMAWKTGTSFGFRDAWAVGFTPSVVIGVWVGNADGHGRPGLTGISAAAPVLFDVAAALPITNQWFNPPYNELSDQQICAQSGFPAGPNCEQKKAVTSLLHQKREVDICRFHQLVRTDFLKKWQLPADCFPADSAILTKWFVLPPLMEHYYRRSHPEYRTLPPVKAGCSNDKPWMDFVYPPPNAVIYQPKVFGGQLNPLVFEVVHRNPEAVLYWHIDNRFAGTTSGKSHQFQWTEIESGTHQLTVVDGDGTAINRTFTLEKK